MKRTCVILVWLAIALVAAAFWAQLVHTLFRCPDWAENVTALVTGIITFWFGCALIVSGE